MKQLTLIPIGGLCNRIYAISSAVHFARKYHLRLRIIWFKDWGMGAGFHDLFNLSSCIEQVEIKDASFGDFFKYAKPIKSNFFLPYLYQKIKFNRVYSWNEYSKSIPVEKWYLSKENVRKIYLMHSWKFFETAHLLDVLSPKSIIQERINKQLNLLSPFTIGVHIRRTDITYIINHSPLNIFIEKMQQEIVANPEVNFYVASDSQEEKEKLIHHFSDRIITVEYILNRNTKNGIVDALVELFTLAHTKKIFGSFQSSYSILASEINKIPLEIMTKDTKDTK